MSSRIIIAGLVLTFMTLGLLPFAFIARSRASQSPNLPPHLVLDMDKQPKFVAQRSTPMFADKRAMRPQIAGTFAQEDMSVKSELLNDPAKPGLIALADGKDVLQFSDPSEYSAVMLGRVRPAGMSDADFNKLEPPNKDDKAIADDNFFYVKRIPAPFAVTAEFMQRGQERFNIYCLPCHGQSGYGDGPVAQRAASLMLTPDAVTGWAQPQNLHEAKIASRPDGHIFNTITNGVRNMPAYDKQISVADRWAIISYVRALERSQNAQPGDVPAGQVQ